MPVRTVTNDIRSESPPLADMQQSNLGYAKTIFTEQQGKACSVKWDTDRGQLHYTSTFVQFLQECTRMD